MPTELDRARQYLAKLKARLQTGEPGELLLPREDDLQTTPTPPKVAPKIAGGSRASLAAIERRWAILPGRSGAREELLRNVSEPDAAAVAANIENLIGFVRLPVGLAGPLRIRGLHARGDYYLPLATTEAALVASYARGCQVISEAGGCTAAVLNEAIGRSPAFKFASLRQAGEFVMWLTRRTDDLRRVAESTTAHGKLVNLRVTLEGNHVFVLMEYSTGDAAGQNMVTIATEAACRWILANAPTPPEHWFVEGNMSGDKKASAQSFQSVRGRKVTCEVVVPAALVRRRLHCEVANLVEYYRVSTVGGIMSGQLGIQGHYANGLAALFIATGQDAACVAESAVGITRIEERGGDVYVSVTLPNLIVGTVGGGTGLATQRACLEILGLAGAGKASALAEVTAGLLLAGEISISAALAAGQFTRAHQKLARKKRPAPR